MLESSVECCAGCMGQCIQGHRPEWPHKIRFLHPQSMHPWPLGAGPPAENQLLSALEAWSTGSLQGEPGIKLERLLLGPTGGAKEQEGQVLPTPTLKSGGTRGQAGRQAGPP